jgi:DNA polymerase I-like protein with 3'-5' exonuclease and polymerase domains
VREAMEGAIELDVPLKVDLGTGESWYASKGG